MLFWVVSPLFMVCALLAWRKGLKAVEKQGRKYHRYMAATYFFSGVAYFFMAARDVTGALLFALLSLVAAFVFAVAGLLAKPGAKGI